LELHSFYQSYTSVRHFFTPNISIYYPFFLWSPLLCRFGCILKCFFCYCYCCHLWKFSNNFNNWNHHHQNPESYIIDPHTRRFILISWSLRQHAPCFLWNLCRSTYSARSLATLCNSKCIHMCIPISLIRPTVGHMSLTMFLLTLLYLIFFLFTILCPYAPFEFCHYHLQQPNSLSNFLFSVEAWFGCLFFYFFLFFQRLLSCGNFSHCKNFQGDYVVDP